MKKPSLFHNISLNENFDDLEYLLKYANKSFDIIPVSQTRIFNKISLTSNIKLKNYYFESTAIESSGCGTFCIFVIAFHINHALSYKIESTFIEIINTKKADIVVCCVFKDPKMDVTELNNHLKEMLKKVSKEQKQIFLLVEFNFNLLKYNMRLFV